MRIVLDEGCDKMISGNAHVMFKLFVRYTPKSPLKSLWSDRQFLFADMQTARPPIAFPIPPARHSLFFAAAPASTDDRRPACLLPIDWP
ncbi:hypothetical protein D3C87_2012650 [compost metagenome]